MPSSCSAGCRRRLGSRVPARLWDAIGTALARLLARLASLTTRRQIDSRLRQSAAGVSLTAGPDSNPHFSASPGLSNGARHLWRPRGSDRLASGWGIGDGGLTGAYTGAAPPAPSVESWRRVVRATCAIAQVDEAFDVSSMAD